MIFLMHVIIHTFVIHVASPDNGPGCIRKSCILGEWGSWSECSVTCGSDGFAHRDRIVLVEEECGGGCHHTRDTHPCKRRCCPQDCEFSPWSPWADCSCSTHCDEPGPRDKCHRSRKITKRKRCGGYCNPILHEQRCGLLCCHKDCVEGEWQEWSECVGACGKSGVMQRSKTILVEARCGGTKCRDNIQIKRCEMDCCPVDCFFGEWSLWSICDSECGPGMEIKSRLLEDPKCGGQTCPHNSHRQQRTCDNTGQKNCKVITKS